jgi:hypothetical protein
MENGTDKHREEFERAAQERQEKITKAFRAFGAAIARSRAIEMTVCPTCEQPHVLDIEKEIWKAVERVRRVKSARR